MTDTHFLSRECLEKDDLNSINPRSEMEKLLEACWNGLLQEILPEIFEIPVGDERLYLWQIKEASHFLELELGEFEETRDVHFSIDPYSFLAIQYYS